MTNPTETVERRALMPFELRADEAAGTVKVVGHAAVFDQEADIAGMFREVIRPGAFTRAIRESDVPFLIEHADLPLARNTSGTLGLSEDRIGLRIETELDMSDPDVMRVVPKMRRGDLSKMSFAFRATRQEWIEPESEDGTPLRILHEVELLDVSVVTMPAYDGTDIALRSLEDKRAAERETQDADAEKVAKRLAAELRVKRLRKMPDLRSRESALAAARRRIGA